MLAKRLNADMFISLHCNHSDNPKARGIEVYVADDTSKYLNESIWFAFQLQDGLNKKLGFESRGVKFGNFQVLRKTVDYFPAILLELGFLSNRDEGEYFQNSENFGIMAKVLVECLSKNFSSYGRVAN